MRIAIGGFQHETNSFIPHKTGYADFAAHGERPGLIRPAQLLQFYSGGPYPISGFIEAMQGTVELVPTVCTSATPGGTVTREAFERVAGELMGALSAELPVDAVYLDLHGAMMTEDYECGESELLRRVRAAVGEAVPIVISLDYHANVTESMVRLSDAIIAYRTYPHVDRVETGRRAARVMNAIAKRGRPRGKALRKLPFLIPLTAQCTMVEPSKGIVDEAAAREVNDVASLSFLAGFPPVDMFEVGPAVVANAWTQEAADAAADALARKVALLEAAFADPLLPPDAAVHEAMKVAAGARRPVILADTQDNPGAGGTGDTVGLLEAMVRLGAEDAAIGVFTDPAAAAAAHQAGAGSTIAIELGGKSGLPGQTPLVGTYEVVRVKDGRFRTTGPVVGGREVDLGPMALLRVGGVSIVLASRRMQAHDQAIFRHLGIEPAAMKILALKSSVHFRADFEPIAERVIVVETPGGNVADAATLPFTRVRPGLRLRPLGPEFRPG